MDNDILYYMEINNRHTDLLLFFFFFFLAVSGFKDVLVYSSYGGCHLTHLDTSAFVLSSELLTSTCV